MRRYCRPSNDRPKVYLYRDPVDFRKAANGLAAIVERELTHNPFDGGRYAFTNRRRNKSKCLETACMFMWQHRPLIMQKRRVKRQPVSTN